jgi:pimeloyl-ACP methyl ester carboxylesterase
MSEMVADFMAGPAHWLLLRGLVREAGHWGRFLPLFRAGFRQATVRAADLPGCGTQHAAVAPGTVAELMAHVRGEDRRLRAGTAEAERPIWLLGISMGGMVACEWLRAYPAEVAGVVLINSSARDLSPAWRRMRPRGALRLARAALARDVVARERHIYRATSAHREREQAVVPAWVELARTHPVTRANARTLLAAARAFRLGTILQARPCLVLASDHDQLVHPGCSRALAGALRGDLAVHPFAGHDLPLDDPEWVVREVQSWWASLGARAHTAPVPARGLAAG